MKGLHKVTFLLLVIGGLNWLLWGAFSWEIGSIFGGTEAAASKVIYILIGLAALVELFSHKANCKACVKGSGGDHAKHEHHENHEQHEHHDEKHHEDGQM